MFLNIFLKQNLLVNLYKKLDIKHTLSFKIMCGNILAKKIIKCHHTGLVEIVFTITKGFLGFRLRLK